MRERFMKFVSPEPNTGCWLWTGALRGNGYGAFSIDGRTWKAHRVAFILHVGPLDNDDAIDHLCGNRWCVNPAHLQAVTQAENNRRIGARRTHCRRGHRFTTENTYEWGGARLCRTCVLDREKRTRGSGRVHKRATMRGTQND